MGQMGDGAREPAIGGYGRGHEGIGAIPDESVTTGSAWFRKSIDHTNGEGALFGVTQLQRPALVCGQGESAVDDATPRRRGRCIPAFRCQSLCRPEPPDRTPPSKSRGAMALRLNELAETGSCPWATRRLVG